MNPDHTFSIVRTFAVPRHVVWQMCTQVEHLKQWWGPKEMTMTFAQLDFRVGGTFHYCLQSTEGWDLWALFTYEDIQPEEKIVFIDAFSDKDGNLSHHPMAPEWPSQILNTLILTEENGRTTMTITATPVHASPQEIKVFDDNDESMRGGFGELFDKLNAYLSVVQ